MSISQGMKLKGLSQESSKVAPIVLSPWSQEMLLSWHGVWQCTQNVANKGSSLDIQGFRVFIRVTLCSSTDWLPTWLISNTRLTGTMWFKVPILNHLSFSHHSSDMKVLLETIIVLQMKVNISFFRKVIPSFFKNYVKSYQKKSTML